MSVLSRRHTVPAQRRVDRIIDLDAPAPGRATTDEDSDAGPSRAGLIIGGAVVVLAIAAGTTAYVVDSDGGSRAATTTTSTTSTGVDAAVLDSEAKRDAAAASRNLTR